MLGCYPRWPHYCFCHVLFHEKGVAAAAATRVLNPCLWTLLTLRIQSIILLNDVLNLKLPRVLYLARSKNELGYEPR